jgi:type I restriction enzyme, S subunit
LVVSETPRTAARLGLTKGWRRVCFGDVVRQVKDTVDPETSGLERYVAGEHMGTDDLHIRSWGTIGDGYLGPAFHMRFRPGQVLYGSRRTYLRKVAYADFEGICANTTFVLEPKDDELLSELLPFIMQTETFHEYSIRHSRGSVNPYVNFRDIASYEFALPPKDEQGRIAEILWAADAQVEQLFAVDTASRQLKGCIESEVFREGCVLMHEAHIVPLGSVLTHGSDGPFGSKLKTSHYAPGGARVVRLQNVGEGFFDNEDKAYISLSYHSELAHYALQPNDVVVAGLGDDKNPVGRACLIPASLGPAVHKADCFCLRPAPVLKAAYLARYLNSRLARGQVLQRAQGTTRLRINVSNLKKLEVLLPDLSVQDRVISVLEGLDAVERDLNNHIHEVQSLRLLLLADLVGGRAIDVQRS